MKKSETRLLTRIGVLLQFLLASSFGFGQVVEKTKTIEITVDDSRPMAAAILQLEELSGIPINYEDVPFHYSADFTDLRVVPGTPPQRVGSVRGGRFSVPIAVDASTGRLNDIEAGKEALTKLTSAYNSSGLPGAFDFEYYKGVFFVKPVRYRDANGGTQTMKPLLSTPVTLPQEKMKVDLALRAVLLQVSQATGSWAGAVRDLGQPRRAVLGATRESADHVIARFLALGICANISSAACAPAHAASETALDIGISYSLLYSSGLDSSRNEYLFHLHQVVNSPWSVSPSPSSALSPPSPPGQAVPENETMNITGDGARPMDAAIHKIEELSGIPINYEDVPLYYAADLYDGVAVSRTPRIWRFSVPIMVDAATGTLNGFQGVEAALTTVVSAYNRSNLPGGFELESHNGVFFVNPVRYRDATGATKPMTPLMSTPITLPQERRTRNQVLRLILDQITTKTGFRIGGPGFAINGMDNEITFGADNEPASHVVARFWGPPAAGSGPGLSYSLLKDRRESERAYVLNVGKPSWDMPPPRPNWPALPRKCHPSDVTCHIPGAWTVP